MSQILAPPHRPDVRAPKPTPSAVGYWIGALLGVVGLVLVGALVAATVVRMNSHIEAFPRTSIPGAVTVRLEASTGRTIYFEGVGPLPLAALNVHVTDPNGQPIVVRQYGLDVRYDVPESPGLVGYAIGTFRSSIGGAYRIETAGTAPTGTSLAVGDSFATSIWGFALGTFEVLLLALGGALLIVIVTAVRRSRWRRTL
jgi:hypothetical protein